MAHGSGASRPALNGGDWRATRARVRKRDKNQCVSCGTRDRLSVHHVVPARLGGTDHMSNLVTLCRRCHDRAETRLRQGDNPSMVTFTSREW